MIRIRKLLNKKTTTILADQDETKSDSGPSNDNAAILGDRGMEKAVKKLTAPIEDKLNKRIAASKPTIAIVKTAPSDEDFLHKAARFMF